MKEDTYVCIVCLEANHHACLKLGCNCDCRMQNNPKAMLESFKELLNVLPTSPPNTCIITNIQEADLVNVDSITQDEMVITKAQALGIYTILMPQWLNRESMYYDDIKELLKQIGERFNL